MVRAETPSTRQAVDRRAPVAWASEMPSRITSRSPRRCRRPRPPRPPRRTPPLFFEDKQGGSLRERLLLASELALQLADALGRRRRCLPTLVESESPALVLGELH